MTSKCVVPMEDVSDLLKGGAVVQLLARGYSMMPFVRHEKDSLEIVPVKTVAVGDIVLVHLPEGRYVAHRVIALEGDAVTLKGDGNLDGREYCRVSDVCGLVTAIIRPSGRSVDCHSTWFLFASRVWRGLPRICRRLFLAIYRRMFL